MFILNVVNNQQYENSDNFKGHGPESHQGFTNWVSASLRFQKKKINK